MKTKAVRGLEAVCAKNERDAVTSVEIPLASLSTRKFIQSIPLRVAKQPKIEESEK
jgi:hypothetical protein